VTPARRGLAAPGAPFGAKRKTSGLDVDFSLPSMARDSKTAVIAGGAPPGVLTLQ
jgi:hypothetical protein